MWRTQRRRGEGRVATRVASMLDEALAKELPGKNLCVNSFDFWFQKGDYVKATWDLARWGADVPIPGSSLKVSLHSWDTMKQCAKSGLTLRQDRRDHGFLDFEVCANSDPI